MVLFFTIGGTFGYSRGNAISNSKQPKLYGVASGPVILVRKGINKLHPTESIKMTYKHFSASILCSSTLMNTELPSLHGREVDNVAISFARCRFRLLGAIVAMWFWFFLLGS